MHTLAIVHLRVVYLCVAAAPPPIRRGTRCQHTRLAYRVRVCVCDKACVCVLLRACCDIKRRGYVCWDVRVTSCVFLVHARALRIVCNIEYTGFISLAHPTRLPYAERNIKTHGVWVLWRAEKKNTLPWRAKTGMLGMHVTLLDHESCHPAAPMDLQVFHVSLSLSVPAPVSDPISISVSVRKSLYMESDSWTDEREKDRETKRLCTYVRRGLAIHVTLSDYVSFYHHSSILPSFYPCIHVCLHLDNVYLIPTSNTVQSL